MHKANIDLREGTDKNNKPWYAVIVTIGDFQTEMQFIDKIHYMYLKTITNNANARVAENSAKH